MTTTDSPELTIFDVGHGNCALVRDGETLYVIDVPAKPRELQLALARLAQEGLVTGAVTEIEAVLVSHGHKDHCGGVGSLLTSEELSVRRLYVNHEPLRGTDVWNAIRIGIRDRERKCPDFEVDNLTTMRTDALQLPRLEVEVLAPSSSLVATSAAEGNTPEGRHVDSNSMSVVMRFSADGTRGVLLAGDIDNVGLDEMLAKHPRPEAEVLVFPHHGGRPGGDEDAGAFAARLAAVVNPDVVVFSHGRRKTGSEPGGDGASERKPSEPTPRRDVIAGVRRGCGLDAHIACTQLSNNCCAGEPPTVAQDHLSSLPAHGWREPGPNSCCAGTLEFRFRTGALECSQLSGHAEWVANHVPQRMCKVTKSQKPSVPNAAPGPTAS